MMPSPVPLTPAPRVACLVADAGIAYNDSKKGSSIHARAMARAFAAEGCAVEVYVFRQGGGPVDGAPPRVVATGWLTRWWRRRLARFERHGQSAPNWMTAIGWLLWHRDFFQQVRDDATRHPERRPTLFYARAAWLAFPYARLKNALGAALVLEVNAVMTIEKAARGELAFAGLTRRIERRMFEAADLILPVSAEIKQQIVAEFGIAPEKIVITPNAVDAERFAPAEHNTNDIYNILDNGISNGISIVNSRNGVFRVGAASSFRAYHGLGTLLRAAALLKGEIPGLRVRLVGGGYEEPQIRALAAELDVAALTEFTGVVDHRRVPELLRDCAVCAAPYEGEHNQYNCPMKLFEYMALKTPVVASRWGDIPNIVEHGRTGLLHEAGDPAALAAALREVWRDPAAARARAEAAYALAQRHTWRAVARRIIDWFRERKK